MRFDLTERSRISGLANGGSANEKEGALRANGLPAGLVFVAGQGALAGGWGGGVHGARVAGLRWYSLQDARECNQLSSMEGASSLMSALAMVSDPAMA